MHLETLQPEKEDKLEEEEEQEKLPESV